MEFADGLGPQRYPAEMHFVNTAADGQILVVAQLYFIDKPDEELAELTYNLGAIHQGDIPINNTAKQVINNPYHWPLTRYGIDSYYTYTGSLTTPPCSTDVTWVVMKQTRMMNDFQLSQFRGAMQSASCDSLPSSNRWVNDNNDKGAPPIGNMDPENITVLAQCGPWCRIPGSQLIDSKCGSCPLPPWMTVVKWNISVNAGENNRPLQPLGDRQVWSYTTPTPMSLQIVQAIFVVAVTWIVISIYQDQIFKKGERDKSQRLWLTECGLPLPDKLAARLVIVDARDASAAAAGGAAPAAAPVAAREPTPSSNVIVAPADAGLSQPLLG